MSEPGFLTITQASEQIRTRQLSPVELTKALLARIERLNPRFHAFIRVTPDLALAAAKTATTGSGGLLGNANIPNTAASSTNLSDILSFVFGLAGAIALLVITIAGLKFVTSQGDPQKVASARMTIFYAVIGLVIAIFSFTIVKFVLGNL